MPTVKSNTASARCSNDKRPFALFFAESNGKEQIERDVQCC